MVTAPQKERISAKFEGSRTAHLQPIIDFLKAHGNQPTNGDDFAFDRDGYGDYRFSGPLDMGALKEQFDFPATLLLNQNSVQDTRNFVGISQHVAQEPPITLAFSDGEQTPAQRLELIDMARSWVVAQGAAPGPYAEAVYARYVAGELTLTQVTDELVSYYQQRRKV